MVGDVGSPNRIGRRRLLAISFGASSLFLSGIAAIPSVAQAATAGASTQGIETVIVSARRRLEDMERVPVAVTALDQKDLDRAQVRTNTDLKYVTPSLNQVMSYSGQGAAYSIRGLGQGFAGASSVTTYFSEVPSITNGGTALYDLASAQVLRGPQGTLFGRATVGGAIVFTPKHPDLDNWEGSLDVTLGNLGRSNITGVLSAPIIDGELAVRVGIHREHMDGYTKIIGSNVSLNGINADSMRIGIEWKPDSRFDTYTVFEARQVNETPNAELLAGYNPNFSLFNLPASTSAPLGAIYGPAVFGSVCASAVASGLSPSATACYDQHLGIAATFKPVFAAEIARTAGGGDSLRSVPDSFSVPHSDVGNTYQLVNNSEFHLGDLGFSDITLKNNFSYNMLMGFFCDDVVGVPNGYVQACSGQNSALQVGNAFNNRSGRLTKNITEEFQVNGVYGDNLVVWLLGFYYSGGNVFSSNDPLPGCTNLNRVLAGILTPNLGLTCANPVTVSGYSWERGIYGNAVVDLSHWITPGLHFTAGVRTTNNSSSSSTAPLIYSYPSGSATLGPITVQAPLNTSGLGWNLALDYQVNDDLMAYVTANRGYKPGGRNNIIGAVGAPGFTPTFGPEIVVSQEVGVKYKFNFSGIQGVLNVDAYRNDYSNIQETLINRVGASTFAYNENVAAALLQGIEVEALLVPSDDVQITAEYSYSDAHYTDFFASDPVSVATPGSPLCVPAVSTPTLCLLDLTREPFPGAPQHQGSVTFRYQAPINPLAGNLFLSLTAYGQSRVYWFTGAQRNIDYFGTTLGLGVANIRQQISQSSYATFNANIEWENIYGSQITGSLWVNNLTDLTYAVGGFTQMAALGINTKMYAPPRTFGIRLSYEFGP